MLIISNKVYTWRIQSLCISAAFILFVKLYLKKCPDMVWLTILALSNPESLHHQVHISLNHWHLPWASGHWSLCQVCCSPTPWNTATSNKFKFPWTTNQYPIVIQWFFLQAHLKLRQSLAGVMQRVCPTLKFLASFCGLDVYSAMMNQVFPATPAHLFVPSAYFKLAFKLARPANTIGCFKYVYKSEPSSYLVSIYCANLLSAP